MSCVASSHHLDAVLGAVVVICIGRRRYATCLVAASDGLGLGTENAQHRGACGGDLPSTIVAACGVVAVSGVAGTRRHPGSAFLSPNAHTASSYMVPSSSMMTLFAASPPTALDVATPPWP